MGHDSLGGGHGHGHGNGNGNGNGHGNGHGNGNGNGNGHGNGNGNGNGNGHGNEHGHGHGHGNEHGNGHGHNEQNGLNLKEILEQLLKDHTPDHAHKVDAHLEYLNHSKDVEHLEYTDNSQHLEYLESSEHSQYLNLDVENYEIPALHQLDNGSYGSDSLVGGYGDDIINLDGLGDHIIQIDNDHLPFQLGDIHAGANMNLSFTHVSQINNSFTFEFTDGDSSITLVGVSASEITTHMEIFNLV